MADDIDLEKIKIDPKDVYVDPKDGKKHVTIKVEEHEYNDSGNPTERRYKDGGVAKDTEYVPSNEEVSVSSDDPDDNIKRTKTTEVDGGYAKQDELDSSLYDNYKIASLDENTPLVIDRSNKMELSLIGYSQKKDANGNPVYDENGNPVYENNFNSKEQWKKEFDDSWKGAKSRVTATPIKYAAVGVAYAGADKLAGLIFGSCFDNYIYDMTIKYATNGSDAFLTNIFKPKAIVDIKGLKTGNAKEKSTRNIITIKRELKKADLDDLSVIDLLSSKIEGSFYKFYNIISSEKKYAINIELMVYERTTFGKLLFALGPLGKDFLAQYEIKGVKIESCSIQTVESDKGVTPYECLVISGWTGLVKHRDQDKKGKKFI